MATGYLTLFDVSGNGLGMASAATSITTENRSLTVGSGTLTAATGTFTSMGGTLSTVSQPNVTTLGGVTSIASLLTISGSQLGIGTSPSEKLHVSVGNVEGIRIQSTNCGALKFYTDSGNTDNRNWMIAQNYNANGDFNILSSSSAGGAPTANTILHMNRSGNTGIGGCTTTVNTTLCVGADGGVNGSGNLPGISMKSVSGTTRCFSVGQGDSNNVFMSWTYNATPANGYGSVSCYSGSNNLVLQEAGGRVGIGTTSPLCTLAIGAGSISDANVPLQLSAAGATKYIGVNRTNGNYGALFG